MFTYLGGTGYRLVDHGSEADKPCKRMGAMQANGRMCVNTEDYSACGYVYVCVHVCMCISSRTKIRDTKIRILRFAIR